MDIIQLARELGKEIQNQEDYIALMAAKQLNDEDEELQNNIERFNLLMADGERHADKDDKERVAEIEEQLQDLYDDIMSNVNMVRYNEIKDRIDETMNKVVAILAASVNGEDPMTFEPEDEDEHHCGGDCGCCHGCD